MTAAVKLLGGLNLPQVGPRLNCIWRWLLKLRVQDSWLNSAQVAEELGVARAPSSASHKDGGGGGGSKPSGPKHFRGVDKGPRPAKVVAQLLQDLEYFHFVEGIFAQVQRTRAQRVHRVHTHAYIHLHAWPCVPRAPPR